MPRYTLTTLIALVLVALSSGLAHPQQAPRTVAKPPVAPQFRADVFRSAGGPARATTAEMPFEGEFEVVDSSFVDASGGILTVSDGKAYLMRAGIGLARLVSERMVDSGVIVRSSPMHTTATLLTISNVLATPDGRVSLVGLRDRPLAGYQTQSGAFLRDSAPDVAGNARLTKASLIRSYSPLHVEEGLYSFSGAGTVSSTRANLPMAPSSTKWEGELIYLPMDAGTRALVLVVFTNEAGGLRFIRDTVEVRGGSFSIQKTSELGRDLGSETLTFTFSLTEGRLSTRWTRLFGAGVLEERGGGSGSRR